MRKLFLLLLLPVLLLADAVNLDRAQNIARKWFENTIGENRQIIDHKIEINDNKPLYYIFNFEKGGNVIVSGNDAAYPVIGFSEKHHFDFEMKSPTLRSFMQVYSEKIKHIYKNNIQSSENLDHWEALEQPALSKTTEDDKVTLDFTSRWAQGYPYNKYCPEDENGRAVVGCVAIAMGQIMNYWEYPDRGRGSHGYYHPTYDTLRANFDTTYNWDNIPDRCFSHSPDSLQNEIAQLLYHLGVSVDMNYGWNASGAFSSAVPNALVNYFNYSDGIQYLQKNNYADDQWISILQKEIFSGRPIYYSGYSEESGGHAFVFDGYWIYEGETDYFHVNWGWGGSSDGYFLFNKLDPDGMDFSYGQDAIINIMPDVATANFDASPLVGVEPLEVEFSDKSSGEVVEWVWDFGDGDTSHAQNPTHIYEHPGFYDVTLTVTDTSGEQRLPKKMMNYIEVRAKDELFGTVDQNRVLADTVHVLDNVTVAPEVELTLSAGTHLVIDGNYKLTVNGDIAANGTAEAPVKIYRDNTEGFSDINSQAGGWQGITVQSKGGDSCRVTFSHTSIEHVKNSNVFMFIKNIDADFSAVTIQNNYAPAIYSISSTIDFNRVTIQETNLYSNMSLRNMSHGINCFYSNLILKNSVIYNNHSYKQGSIYLNNSGADIVNTTITQNQYQTEKIATIKSENTKMINIINSIVWNDGNTEFDIGNSDNVTILNSNIKQSYLPTQDEFIDWTSNIDTYPQLDGVIPYPWSPCINAGTEDTLGIVLDSLDIVGNSRFYDEVDIGAVELQSAPESIESDFSVSASTGFTPFTVNFSDTLGNATRSWDFNNDGIVDSEAQDTSWTFTTPGFYISKMITETAGQEPVYATKYIRVFNSPPELLVEIVDTLEFYEDNIDSSLNVYDIIQDPAQEAIEFTVTSENFDYSIVDSILYLTPGRDFFGNEDITLSAKDLYDSTAAIDIPVSILPVNDKPVLTNFPDSLSFIINSADSLLLNDYVDDVDNDLAEIDVTAKNAEKVTSYLRTYDESIYLMFKSTGISGVERLTLVFDDGTDTTETDMAINIMPETATDDPISVATKFSLAQNYPNPFNPRTVIEYSVPKTVNVTLSIYNILGQEIVTLTQENKPQGHYKVTWNGRDASGALMPAGVYLYKISAGNFTAMKKMLFVK